MSPAARALENTLLSQFDGHDLDLPPLPRVPECVLRRLQDPDCDFAVLAADIAEDQVMAAAVMRMANSPFYRGTEQITTLQPAVCRLGTKALRTLMLSQALRAVTLGRADTLRILADHVAKRSLASAAMMRGLSAFTTVDREEAFLIGLLHDIGNAIVLREFRKQQRYIAGPLGLECFEYLCYECHQEFGELLAAAWSLPPNLQTLIADHHRDPPPDDPLRTERLLVQITDMSGALLGYGSWAPYHLLSARAIHDLGLADREDFKAFLVDLPEQVEDLIGYW